jgi:hypothetical protein
MDSVHGPGFGVVASHENDSYFVRWCCRNQCGGVFSLARNRWTLTTPISFSAFLDLLAAEGVFIPESFEDFGVRRWIKACRLAAGEVDR